jgi:hypothetical protein
MRPLALAASFERSEVRLSPGEFRQVVSIARQLKRCLHGDVKNIVDHAARAAVGVLLRR